VRIGNEFSGDSRQPIQRAHRRSSHYEHPSAAYEANDRVSRGGKPKLDSGIENLVGGGVPAKSQNELARPGA
jgi:hypothetical protein